MVERRNIFTPNCLAESRRMKVKEWTVKLLTRKRENWPRRSRCWCAIDALHHCIYTLGAWLVVATSPPCPPPVRTGRHFQLPQPVMPFDASVDESLCYRVEAEVSTDSRDETRPLIEIFLGRGQAKNKLFTPERGDLRKHDWLDRERRAKITSHCRPVLDLRSARNVL
jgi:hypothetical protein